MTCEDMLDDVIAEIDKEINRNMENGVASYNGSLYNIVEILGYKRKELLEKCQSQSEPGSLFIAATR